MKDSTKKKISIALKRYHRCAKRSKCGNRHKRRIKPTLVKSSSKKGTLKKKRSLSKGQKTTLKMLKGLKTRARFYDKVYKHTI